jgi:hypothetical protein
MANTDGPKGFKFIKSLAGEATIRTETLDTSQTIAKGDALISASGVLQIAVTSSAQLYGIAAEAVTTDTVNTASIKFYPAIRDYVFEGQTSGTFADTIIGTACDIEGATGAMEVNENATTYDVIQIIGRNPNSPAGTNAKVRFIILRSSYIPTLAAK